MRSGCSLPATVLLLLFLGFSAWGARHWKPSIICDNSNLSWVCGGHADVAGGLPGLGGGKKHVRGSDTDPGTGQSSDLTKVAGALPWPIAEKPHKWSNFRKGAYSFPAIAAPIAVAIVAKTTGTGFSWPVAKAPRKWTNFRKGAFSYPARRQVVQAKPKTVAHGFPWPIAEAPRKWTNFRKAPKRKKIVAKKVRYKTVAHPFPWPVAKKSRKWTNFRAPPKRVTGVAHGFPWPIAKAPRKWTNFRAPPKRKPATGIAHGFPWPVAKAPRKWTNFRAAPVRHKASDCGAELNRVAQGGVILFETASAKLRDSSYETLDSLAGVAKNCDRVNIVVEGHTDDRGSAGFNQKLSERRAQSVAAYLQGAGVSSGSLSAIGYGESRPAVPNTSQANLAKNRRIEFSVSGN